MKKRNESKQYPIVMGRSLDSITDEHNNTGCKYRRGQILLRGDRGVPLSDRTSDKTYKSRYVFFHTAYSIK
jgi:hypothetical protein